MIKVSEMGITNWVKSGGTRKGYRKVLKIACAKASVDFVEGKIELDEVDNTTMQYMCDSEVC